VSNPNEIWRWVIRSFSRQKRRKISTISNELSALLHVITVTEFCQGYNTPAQSSFLDTTEAQPMIGAIKTLGEAAPQEFQGYGVAIKSATPTA